LVATSHKRSVWRLESSPTGTNPVTVFGKDYTLTYTYGQTQPHSPSSIAEDTNDRVRSWPVEHDASGNITRTAEYDSRGDQNRQITWDGDDRITGVWNKTQQVNLTSYAADGTQGVHLRQKTQLEETCYLGPNLTLEGGRYITKHVYAGGELLASKTDPDFAGQPPVLHQHSDHPGSTHYSTDHTQALVEHDEYFPSGEPWIEDFNSSYPEGRQSLFTGKSRDPSTGFYDFGARHYDARMGQWLSADPAFDGLNLYAYVHNNPTNARRMLLCARAPVLAVAGLSDCQRWP
jgi:RHS repeat-associated protein